MDINIYVGLLQRRIGMISNSESTTKLIFMLSPSLKMHKSFMNWRIICKVNLETKYLNFKKGIWRCLLVTNYNLIFPFVMAGCGADIHVIVKIESADSIPNLHSIITASDGVISLIIAFYLLVAPQFDGQFSFRPWILSAWLTMNIIKYL